MVKYSKILTKSSSQTKKIGKILAKEFLKTFTKTALVLGLIGDLGGGKTTFLQGFAKGLGIKEKILSPSFVIIKKFKISADSCSNSCKFASFYHIDCYRIKKPKEILDLGFREIVSTPQNIVAIEWADRIRKILPKGTLILKYQFANKNERKIMLK